MKSTAFNRWRKALFAIFATFFFVGAAFAIHSEDFQFNSGQMFDVKRTYWVDNHQDVTIRFTVQPNGDAHFHSRYSNGKKWDGDHFKGRIILLDSYGNVVIDSIAGVGLNGSGLGGTNVAYRDIKFKIPSDYLPHIKTIRFEAGHSDAVNDARWWADKLKFVAKVIGSEQGGALFFGPNSNLKALKPLSFQ